MAEEEQNSCGYQGQEFGASYLDSLCVGGYLMDADSEILSDIPCPECNHRKWLEHHKENAAEMGWLAYFNEEPPIPPFLPTHRLRRPDDAYQLRIWWLNGYREGIEERKSAIAEAIDWANSGYQD